MAKHVVARVSEIPEGGRVLVTLQGRSIGVFRVNGRFYALLNRCPHMGAELCRGSIVGRLDADAPGSIVYSKSRRSIQCPWHGWEYDLETGQSYFDSSVRAYPIGVEHGDQVTGELEAGEAAAKSGPEAGDVLAEGLSGPTLRAGPFVAETYPVAIEDDYIVVTLPGGRGRARRERSAREPAV
jgi:3-phenylpropionate/trans-cinnamate dioxygenase ferredoxin subunit